MAANSSPESTAAPYGTWNHNVAVQPNNFVYKSLSDWAVNIAVGCGHACRFCYVPSTSTNKLKPQLKKLGVSDPDADWGNYVFLRTWDEDEFLISLRRAQATPEKDLSKDGNRAVIYCSTTDPYQVFRHPDPDERKKLETSARTIVRRSLELIRDHSSLNVRILTRSPLARTDFDLFKSFGHRLLFGMSLPTLRNDLAKVYEPKAPAPSTRLATLKAAKEAGLNVYVAMAPTYPECDVADYRTTLTAIAELEPYTVFHEPINIRSENVARIAEQARQVGVTLNTAVYATRETWKDYALDALLTVQRVAKDVGLGTRLHLWPDRNLGSQWVIDSLEPARRDKYQAWLKACWNRVSEWPKPSTEDKNQMKILSDLVSRARKGEAWTDREIAALDVEDARLLGFSRDFDKLPRWAQCVIEGILIEYYTDPRLAAQLMTSPRGMPSKVVAAARAVIEGDRPLAPKSSKSRDELRSRAYSVWQTIRTVKRPASHPASRPLMEQFGISKGALGAIYAHFTMGKVPPRTQG